MQAQQQQHQGKQQETSVFTWGFLQKGKQTAIPTIVKQLQGKNIVKVVSGGFFYMVLSGRGQIFAWGLAKHNRFGIQGDLIEIPKQIPLKQRVIAISAGNWHSMAVTAEGTVFATGHNKYGSCGVGTTENVSIFTKCALQLKAKQVACGDGFSLILTSQGDIYSCGHHQFNGHKSKQNITKPKILKIEGQKFKCIAAGFTHSVCIAVNGDAYSWGDSTFYQLGHGNKSHVQQPKKIEKVDWSEASQRFLFERIEKWAQHGQIYSFGAGYKGKLGHADQWSHADSADEPYPRVIKHIETRGVKTGGGGIHSTLIGQDGGLYSFGCGSDGRLGHVESNQYRYLYREGYPRRIQTLQKWRVIDLCSSYYQNICLAVKREEMPK